MFPQTAHQVKEERKKGGSRGQINTNSSHNEASKQQRYTQHTSWMRACLSRLTSCSVFFFFRFDMMFFSKVCITYLTQCQSGQCDY